MYRKLCSTEEDIREALVKRYPRTSYTLATKLNAFMMAPNEKAAKQQFYKSLERTVAGYFDYYLLHAFMENNYTKYDQSLNEDEQKIIQQAQRILGNSSTIPCTACHCCTDGCPNSIPIPDIFSAANKQLGNGQRAEAVHSYKMAVSEGHHASDCINCKQCERACPQHLPITEHLKQCADMFEK